MYKKYFSMGIEVFKSAIKICGHRIEFGGLQNIYSRSDCNLKFTKKALIGTELLRSLKKLFSIGIKVSIGTEKLKNLQKKLF